MALGKVHLYLNGNRQGTGEKWLWSYFEPNSGLDRNRVSMLFGNLDLALDQYNIVVKSKLDGYDVDAKRQERLSRGYKLLDPFAADDLQVVMELIKVWQPILFKSSASVTTTELFNPAFKGLQMLDGDHTLLSLPAAPKPLVLKRVLVSKNPVASRYDW